MESPAPTRHDFRGKIRAWIAAHPYWTLTLVVLAVFAPFLGKPFNMDDPLFLWTARQIHAHPLDPYGFQVNWYGTAQPMWKVTENPPLAGYYLALAAGVVGWTEAALHLAFLLPALAVILGTHRLARRFCERPLTAALATLFTPVFLVSSGTVMCDVLMLAFWVWAVVFWMEGLERNSTGRLVLAGILLALAALSKYFGAGLLPLLAVYAGMERRKRGAWTACLAIPLLALGAYEWATFSLYHQALFSQAAGYAGAMNRSGGGNKAAAGLTALTFTGGCFAVVLCMSPWLWRARVGLALAAGAGLFTGAVFLGTDFWQKYTWLRAWPAECQIVLWTIGGLSVLALAVAEIWKRRDASAWLLALWVGGTFVFTALVNWTINGRSILPMAPAVGILLARRLEKRSSLRRRNVEAFGSTTVPVVLAGVSPANSTVGSAGHLGKVFGGTPKTAVETTALPQAIAWVIAAVFALWVAQADFLLAGAVRKSAMQTWQHYTPGPRPVWFQGHWGFQYYMTELGGRPWDSRHSTLADGDFLFVPLDNTNVRPPDGPGEELSFAGPRFLTTMNPNVGAGFYAAKSGPLPFAFGPVPPEVVDVFHGKAAPSQSQK